MWRARKKTTLHENRLRAVGHGWRDGSSTDGRESVRAACERLGSDQDPGLCPALGQQGHVVAAGLAVSVAIQGPAVSVEDARGGEPQFGAGASAAYSSIAA